MIAREPFEFSTPVVCGVDFSVHARRALAVAARLAARLGQPLVIVSALDPLLAEAADLRMGPGRLAADAQRDLEVLAGEVLSAEERLTVRATFECVVGDAATGLLDAADRARASIVAVGTQGLGRAGRLLFGSTTLRLMRATTRPVLAVPPAGAEGATADAVPLVRRIVCGVDFSETSIDAARAAAALGAALTVPVTLVHAAETLATPSAWDAFAREADERAIQSAAARLASIAATFGAPAPGVEVRAGDAETILTDLSASGPPALIVVGLKGASGQRPGSTALRVIADTRTPTLAVP